MKIWYDFLFERLGRMHENKNMFLFFKKKIQRFDKNRVF
jgi:hypothetical protein